jgi:LDH2 family malate/lactate/ureidoglycolate dehydrogenase
VAGTGATSWNASAQSVREQISHVLRALGHAARPRAEDGRPTHPDVPVLVAGEPEAAQRAQRERNGVPLPPALDAQLRDICTRCGAPYVPAPVQGAAR